MKVPDLARKTYAGPMGSVDVDPALLEEMLRAYKPNCKYLKRCTVEWPTGAADDEAKPPFVAAAQGDFEIPESCYIDDTGHLNAVEFNICFNQAYYVLVAQCIASGIVPALKGMPLERYKRRHLPDVLIHDLTSRFSRVIDRTKFQGQIAISDCAETSNFIYFRTFCSFWDDQGGYARGDVTLALLNGPEED